MARRPPRLRAASKDPTDDEIWVSDFIDCALAWARDGLEWRERALKAEAELASLRALTDEAEEKVVSPCLCVPERPGDATHGPRCRRMRERAALEALDAGEVE